MQIKINKPKVTEKYKIVTFWDVYDKESPYIERVVIKDCSIDSVTAESVEFTEVIFRNVKFEDTAIPKLFLRDVIFEKCDLSNAQFEESTIQRVTFYNCQMTGVNLADSRFTDVSFQDCNLQLATLGYSKQKLVVYHNCLLKQSDMYENKLQKVKFDMCNLTGMDFSNTLLNGIDLSTSVFDQMTVGIKDLKGCIVNQEQAKAFALLLGLVIKD